MERKVTMITVLAVMAGVVPVFAEISLSGDVTPSDTSTWDSSTLVYICHGENERGALTINGGEEVTLKGAHVGYGTDAIGTFTVDGEGTTCTMEAGFTLAHIMDSTATLNVTNGANLSVNATLFFVAQPDNATAQIFIDGQGSTINAINIYFASSATGTLTISNNGLLAISHGMSSQSSGSSVNISDGGQLALSGTADTIADFIDLLYGHYTSNVNVWSASADSYVSAANAVAGVDYTLTAGEGDLSGYTVLTAVPEPATMALFGLGSLVIARRKK